jgi:hypothetical protein
VLGGPCHGEQHGSADSSSAPDDSGPGQRHLWPRRLSGGVSNGSVPRQPGAAAPVVQQLDFAATFAALVGLPPPASNVGGVDAAMWAALCGDPPSAPIATSSHQSGLRTDTSNTSKEPQVDDVGKEARQCARTSTRSTLSDCTYLSALLTTAQQVRWGKCVLFVSSNVVKVRVMCAREGDTLRVGVAHPALPTVASSGDYSNSCACLP